MVSECIYSEYLGLPPVHKGDSRLGIEYVLMHAWCGEVFEAQLGKLLRTIRQSQPGG